MLSSVIPIARNTFIEAIRQPVFFVIVMLCGLLQVVNTWITGYSMGYSNVPGEVTGDDKLLLDIALSTIFVCGMLLAAVVATSAISREIENKTILTVVSKPVARHTVVIGKYIGVAGAMVIAIYIMVLGLLLALRHGVLSTAADDPDQPVILFTLLAVGLPLLLAAVTNYMYGWPFTQTAILSMVPALTLAWIGVLMVSEKWAIQPLATDLKPQIMLACIAMGMALLVLTAIATAASTRLGQVMTIVVCAGVFVLGLLSNHLIGRHVFENEAIAQVEIGMTEDVTDESFTKMGSTWRILLKRPPSIELGVGDVLYWSPSPNGVGIVTDEYGPFDAGSIDLGDTKFAQGTPGAVVIVEIVDDIVRLKNIGNPPVAVTRPPGPEDYLFTKTTTINPVALGAWAAVPNMHSFWLVDAITQARTIPRAHIGLVALYAMAQIIAALSVAVILFQSRDVG